MLSERMKKIFKFISYILIGILFAVFTLYLFIPKYILADYLLSKKGIFLIPEDVDERWDKLTLKKVKLYVKNKEEAYFDKIETKIDIIALRVKGKCKEGYIFIEVKPFEYNFNANKFTCLERIPLLNGKIKIKDNKIYGNIYSEDIEIDGRKINHISIDFKGENLAASMNVDGFDLQGEGKLKPDISNPLNSEVNINISGIINIAITGTLQNPIINFR